MEDSNDGETLTQFEPHRSIKLNMRICVCGPSSSGKTTTVLNLLHDLCCKPSGYGTLNFGQPFSSSSIHVFTDGIAASRYRENHPSAQVHADLPFDTLIARISEFSDYLLTTDPDPRTILVIDYYDYDVIGIFEHIHQAIELNAITIIATIRPGPMSHFIRKCMDYALFLSCTPETVQSIAFWLPSRPATFAMHAMTHLVSLHPGLSLVVTLKESIYYYIASRYAMVVAHHWICTKCHQVERFTQFHLDAMLRKFNEHVPAHLRYPE